VQTVVIADYDPAWPQTFETPRRRVAAALHHANRTKYQEAKAAFVDDLLRKAEEWRKE